MSTDPGLPTFYFRVATPEGGVHAGKIVASSILHAEDLLVRGGFRLLRIEGRPISESWLHREIGIASHRRLRVASCATICRELALLLTAGVPLADALGVMMTALPKRSEVRRFLAATRNALRLGHSLSGAIEATGHAVPADLLPVLRAGEQSGTLATALQSLARGYEEALQFKSAIVSATAYPALLLAVSVGVLALIAFVVSPNLLALFESMDRPPPAAIAILAGTAAFLIENGLLVGALAGAVIGSVLTARNALKNHVSIRLLNLPGLGGLMRWTAGRRFAATLGLHLASRVPLGVALPNALEACGMAVSKARVQSIVADVRGGSKLATALARADVFPRKLVQMIEIGESGGKLVDVLDALLAEAKARVEQQLGMVTTLLAPVLILIVGGLIGSLVFSVFSALLQINEVVS